MITALPLPSKVSYRKSIISWNIDRPQSGLFIFGRNGFLDNVQNQKIPNSLILLDGMGEDFVLMALEQTKQSPLFAEGWGYELRMLHHSTDLV